MKKKKILAITSVFPNSKEKDKGIFTLNLLKHFKNAEIKVIAPVAWFPFISWNRPRVPKKEKIEGFTVFHPKFFSIPKILKNLDCYFFYFSILKFKKLAKKADLIYCSFGYPDGAGAFLLAKKLKKPFFITLHRGDILDLDKIRIKQIGNMVNESKKIIFVSKSMEKEFKKKLISKNNTEVIPNGVDTKIFRPLRKDLSRKIIGISKEKKVFLTVGNYFKRKGYFELVESFKKIKRKDKILIIIGSDKKENKKIKQKIDESGLSKEVILTGSVDNKKLPYFYSAADVYCLVSHSEGWPCSVMEALACGKPCIATEESAGEFITKDLGIITNYKNLTKNMEKALKKKWNPKKIRKFAEKNTWNKTAQKMDSLFEQVLNSNL